MSNSVVIVKMDAEFMNRLIQISTGLLSRVRNGWYRLRGMKIDGYAWLQSIEVPRFASHIHLGQNAALDRGVTLLCSPDQKGHSPLIQIGTSTYINRHTIIDASQSIIIGSYAMIGPFCYITDHDHSFGNEGRPSTGPLKSIPTHISDNCWIGAHVVILKGVTIGRGATIGAGSVVTKDVPEGGVIVGNPGHPIRHEE